MVYTEHEEELLNMLLAHPVLRKSPASLGFLRLLKERSQSSEGVTLTELTKELFTDGDTAKAEKRFRTLLYRVRSSIKAIYDAPTSDFQEQPRPEIEAQGELYSLKFSSADSRPYLSAFWRPYLICRREERQVQTSDRFFLRLGSHLYFRDVTSPDWPNWLSFLRPLCEELGLPLSELSSQSLHVLEQDLVDRVADAVTGFLNREFRADVPPERGKAALIKRFRPILSRHYVSAGEAVGLTHIAELFQLFQKEVLFGNRAGTASDNEAANIIQIGKPRHEGMLMKLLQTQRLVCGQDRITNRARPDEVKEDDKDTYVDEPTVLRVGSIANPPSVKYALVSRFENRKARPGHKPYVITSIVASHGRVTEDACRYLVDETSMASLFKELDWDLRSVPETFQFVLKANVYRGSDRDRTSALVTGIEPGWFDWPEAKGDRGA